ncbi:Rid family hydrolase [Streptomyces sp. MRC013]|uniref:RidA family protein n=1 Tax=Streptomyces sp. MRC013 TaxID=2898276 RepID=UPI0020264900|nr:Rid family hydrolase [Streptomyces sp. MRC013]URM92390.1 Rid family hydrolase [Streptomyces sp. MRC013]
MPIQPVTGPGIQALGPYSPAVRAGDLVFVSAQTGVDPRTGGVPEGPFEAECRQAFANLARVLDAAGSRLDLVVKVTVLYGDPADLAVLNSVFAEVFPTAPPARTAAVVTLAGGRRVSVDAIAHAAGRGADAP